MIAAKSRDALAINPTLDPEAIDPVHAAVDKTGAVLSGHFSLRRELHTNIALRFRAIGRDPDVCTSLARYLVALPSWSWEGAKILSPESAGFFLGHAIATIKKIPHAVVQTDLRRLPTSELIAGQIHPGDQVILVNDVGSTGQSLDPMLSLAERCGARVLGALLFTVIEQGLFDSYCNEKRIRGYSLTVARWKAVRPGNDCASCRSDEEVVPITDFS